ncbi:LysR substrate-binding domain-containing protein [Herminiimonas contaminans]|uniref:LysR family transcriptional regulator n=1 Tax=Herminiimonas contaminans TaxID=1111140 RepID=A0ABS0EW85_9BURK|nr:LysR substrate-binding domain-containing protein [Herminiimonas contaminans]MBF8179106.1 LysR family transcriptional regulator [Herminiimonas contaminans]
MSRLPLGYLPAFQAAAELGNLRAAATLLHVTPSAVSQQILKLEERLGFVLFERQGRKVVLNDAGKLLLQSVQGALQGLDQGVQDAAALASDQAELVVRISVVPSLALRWLLPRIGRWRAKHPGVRLQIDATQRLTDLAREGLHVGIRAGSGTFPGLLAEPLIHLDMPLTVLGCPDAAKRLSGRPPEALASEPLLGDPLLWDGWFKSAGVVTSVKPAATFADTGLMLQAAEQDIGLALARGIYTVDALRAGRLVRLSEIALPYHPPQDFYLVYPPALRDWPPLQHLRAWLADEVALSGRDLADIGAIAT